MGCIGLIWLASPYSIFAQTPTQQCGPQPDGAYILCTPVPGIDPVQRDIAGFIRQLYQLSLALAGSIVFFQVVRGGIQYAFSGVVDKKKEALGIFQDAAIGLALLMGSYLILYTINPALVRIQPPNPETYFPGPRAQTKEFQQEYRNFLSTEGRERHRLEQEKQDTVQLIEREIESLRALDERSPEQEQMLRELMVTTLPQTKEESSLATRERRQFEHNRVTDRIEELERKKTLGVTGWKKIYAPSINYFWRTPFNYTGLTTKEQYELENLYERRAAVQREKNK